MRNRSLLQRPDSFLLNYSHPLAQGLVFAGLGAHAGSTRYHDSSAYGNTGTLTNMDAATQWVKRIGRRGVDIIPTGDVVSIPDNPSLVGMGALTISLWSFADSFAAGYPRAVTKNDLSSYGILLNDGVNAWSMGINGTQGHSATGTGSSAIGALVHVAGVYNGANITMYVNGVQSGTPQAVTGTISTTASTLCLGNRSGTDRTFDGQLYDVLIHNRALTLPEIKQLADPSNVMLSGLINPPKRRLYGITYHPATAASLFASVCITTKGIKAIRRVR